ncbi:hypothetical protein Scep_021498 [Stephania cephalantha]|uniref:Uncharacterized protein n=1 Tax=Stephania cephalantha TaxID=152367 RepID=A0AAP0I1X5_9MAGN
MPNSSARLAGRRPPQQSVVSHRRAVSSPTAASSSDQPLEARHLLEMEWRFESEEGDDLDAISLPKSAWCWGQTQP